MKDDGPTVDTFSAIVTNGGVLDSNRVVFFSSNPFEDVEDDTVVTDAVEDCELDS